jgi:60 kDa SS-A/Ro ribonucleoprotein
LKRLHHIILLRKIVLKHTKRKNQWTNNVPLFKPDVLNAAGFPAYTTTVEDRALQCAMTGGTANTFYINSEENVNNMISSFDALDDIELFKRILVYARNEGYNRSAPICGLAVLSKKDIEAFKEVAPLVLRNPKDYGSFIDLCRSKSVREGLGRGIKDNIRTAVNDLSEYHALKYPTHCLDMINISHAKPTDITAYLKTGITNENQLQLRCYEALKRCTTEEDAVKLITYGKLPFETVTSQIGKFSKSEAVWTALLYNAPYTNLLRNLNTFDRHGVFNNQKNLDYVSDRLIDSVAIKKSMVYPFQFYIAYNNLNPGKLDGLRSVLEKALKLSLNNVAPLTEKVAIASDVSGSMDSNVLGDKSVLQCVDLVSLFTAVLYEKCVSVPIVIPFSDDVILPWMGENYNRLAFMEKVTLFHTVGGTSLSSPVEYLHRNRLSVDKIIAFTDNMEWVGSPFMVAFDAYKKMINPKAKAVLVTLLPTASRPAPPWYEDITFVYGWSDKVLDIVTRNPENQMSEVRNLTLNSKPNKENI